jgi:hypothetical protein
MGFSPGLEVFGINECRNLFKRLIISSFCSTDCKSLLRDFYSSHPRDSEDEESDSDSDSQPKRKKSKVTRASAKVPKGLAKQVPISGVTLEQLSIWRHL